MPQIEAVAIRGIGVFETFKAILTDCLALVDDPRCDARGPEPVDRARASASSMFPEAEPPALHSASAAGSEGHGAPRAYCRDHLSCPGRRSTTPGLSWSG